MGMLHPWRARKIYHSRYPWQQPALQQVLNQASKGASKQASKHPSISPSSSARVGAVGLGPIIKN